MRRSTALALGVILPSAEKLAVLASGDLKEPFAIDWDKAGTAYIAEMGGNRISVLDKSGKLSVLAGTSYVRWARERIDEGRARSARDTPHSRTRPPLRGSIATLSSSSIAVCASTPPSLVAASSVVRRVIWRKSSYLMMYAWCWPSPPGDGFGWCSFG